MSDPFEGSAGATKTTATYREIAPPLPLAPYLTCAWHQTTCDSLEGHRQRILPDGCMDLIWIDQLGLFVVGTATRAVIVELPPRSTIVGIRFRPGAAPSILGLPADELLDLEIPLRDISRPVADPLSDQLASLQSVEEKLQALEAVVISRLPVARPTDDLVTFAVDWLARHPGEPVHHLSILLDLSDRHLRRRFTSAVGYGPKTLQRILRLRRLIGLASRVHGKRSADRTVRLELAALALEAGYADQAHMTREVTRLASISPSLLLPRAKHLKTTSDPFKTGHGT